MLIFLHQQCGSQNELKYVNFFHDFTKKLEANDYKIIIIDNEQESNPIFNGYYKLGSDNFYREFSAWEKGLKFVKGELNIFDFDLVATNETFMTHHEFNMDIENACVKVSKAIFSAREPLIGGDLDRIPVNPPYFRSNINRYISTYFFVCNRNAQRYIDSFIPNEDFNQHFCERFVKGCNSVIKKESIIKNSDYLEFIETWLYKYGGRRKWYNFELLSEKNFEIMRLKLLSILIEHRISQNLFERGVEAIDIKDEYKRGFINQVVYTSKKILRAL